MLTFFTVVSSGSEDSSCRISSWVSACVIPACGVTPGTVASSACSSTSKIGEVSVNLAIPSTVSLRAFLSCSSISLIIHLEKGIGEAIAVFRLVPSAANKGYNDCCGIPGITSWKGDSSSCLCCWLIILLHMNGCACRACMVPVAQWVIHFHLPTAC